MAVVRAVKKMEGIMESMLPLLLQVVAGGLGGNGVAQILKQFNLGTLGNTVAGGLGGLGASALAGAVPGLSALADTGLAGDGILGLVGGAVVTACVGVIKQMLANNSQE